MLHGEAGDAQSGWRRVGSALRHGEQDYDAGEDHEVCIEKDEDAGVVEAPFPLQTTGCLGHTPCGDQKGKKLPARAVQVFDIWETCQAQAGGKSAQREEDGAQQRLLPHTEDVRAKRHNLSL